MVGDAAGDRHRELPARVNGVTRTVTALTAHLRRRGHQALLFAPGPGVEEHDGFEVVRVLGSPG